MSSWIEELGVAFFRERKDLEQRKDAIAKSDFFSQIISQIKTDVETINQEANWRPAVGSVPLSIKGIEPEGIRVIKSQLPGAHLNLVRTGDRELTIELQEIQQSGGTPKTLSSDTLRPVVREGSVFLTDAHELYRVPEGVSQYALTKLLNFMANEYKKQI